MHKMAMPVFLLIQSLYMIGSVLADSSSPSSSAPSACACGYTVNATTGSEPYTLFTDLLETDFLHLYTLPTSVDIPVSKEVGWAPQAYNVSATDARGPYGKSAELGNVVPNPLAERDVWGGQGKLGGPPGLQFWVRGQDDLLGSDSEEMVRVGEINSLRRDMRYGSFRVAMRMSDVPGTCAAFFWYRNNTQEIDMEYLTHQTNISNGSYPINLVVQTPASASAGYNAADTSTFLLFPLPFVPDHGYHEYRFDWTPENITFYADGVRLGDFDNCLEDGGPDAPGTLMLNHWSNGNPGWSGGPPQQDAVLTVSYIKAYFNSSNETRETEWNTACGQDRWQGRTCQIPEFPQIGIDPLNNASLDPGKSFFFMYEDGANVNQSTYPAATHGGSSGSGSMTLQAPRVWQLSCWIALFGVFGFVL